MRLEKFFDLLCMRRALHFVACAVSVSFLGNSAATAEPLDILDIRLGDTLERAEQRMLSHFEGRDFEVFFMSSRSQTPAMNSDLVFSDGLLYVADLNTEHSRTEDPFSEMLIVFFDDHSVGDPVIAISRVLGLTSYSVTNEDVELGLFDRYGQPGRIRNWSHGSTDYMWASDEDIQAALMAEPHDWGYVREFEDTCFLRHRGGDFRPGQINEFWLSPENTALPNSFFFSSQNVHRDGELQRALDGPGFTYLDDADRTARIERDFFQELSERRACGEIFIANIDLWRLGGPGDRAFLFLYDLRVVVDIHNRIQREAEFQSPLGDGILPIEY